MSTKRGAVATSIVCTAALRRGRDVLFPAADLAPPYDIVVRGIDGVFYPVQVKRAHVRVRGKSRSLRVNCTDSNGQPYTKGEVAFIAVVDVDTLRVWLIPLTRLGRQKTIAVSGGKYDEYLL